MLPKSAASGSKKSDKQDGDDGFWASLGRGVATGFGKRAGYIPSGKDETPKEEVKKTDDQTSTDWGKIALIGGGVLVGITSIVLITRALTSKE